LWLYAWRLIGLLFIQYPIFIDGKKMQFDIAYYLKTSSSLFYKSLLLLSSVGFHNMASLSDIFFGAHFYE